MESSCKNVDLTALAKEVYSQNKAKGFWNGYLIKPERRIPEALSLIHSEISEMLEGHRNELFTAPDIKLDPETTDFKILFRKHIKNSVEDEYADIAIRVLDLAGALNFDMTFNNNIIIEYTSFFDFINMLHSLSAEAYNDQENIEFSLKAILRTLFSSEQFIGANLMKHIKLKLAYNKLREHKHGKKY